MCCKSHSAAAPKIEDGASLSRSEQSPTYSAVIGSEFEGGVSIQEDTSLFVRNKASSQNNKEVSPAAMLSGFMPPEAIAAHAKAQPAEDASLSVSLTIQQSPAFSSVIGSEYQEGVSLVEDVSLLAGKETNGHKTASPGVLSSFMPPEAIQAHSAPLTIAGQPQLRPAESQQSYDENPSPKLQSARPIAGTETDGHRDSSVEKLQDFLPPGLAMHKDSRGAEEVSEDEKERSNSDTDTDAYTSGSGEEVSSSNEEEGVDGALR